MRRRILTLTVTVLALLGVLAAPPAHADPHESFSNLSGSGFNDGISSFHVGALPSGNMELAAFASISPCIHGEFCMYTNSGYSGEQLTWFWPTGCWNVTNQFNNTISSFHNYTESVATIYDAANCPVISKHLPHYSFAPPADIKNLNALPYWPVWNDAVSSIYFGTPPQSAQPTNGVIAQSVKSAELITLRPLVRFHLAPPPGPVPAHTPHGVRLPLLAGDAQDGNLPSWSNGHDAGLRNRRCGFDSRRGCATGYGPAW